MRTLIALLLATVFGATVAAAEPYSYPYQDPYFASLTFRILKPARTAPVALTLPGLPGRSSVPLLEGRSDLVITALARPEPAPLVLLVPGFGGLATDGASLFLAETLHGAGYSVLIVPSSFSWPFVLSQSRHAVPGYLPEDAKDVYRVLQQALAKARATLGLKVTETNLVGYSLGAAQIPYLLELDDAQKKLGLKRAVMINPPLDVGHAVRLMDDMNGIGKAWTLEERNALWGQVLEAGSGLLARDIMTPEYFMGLDRVLRLPTATLMYLIGSSFRQTLADVFFTSQQINDLGLLKVEATRYRRSARQSEAASYSFGDYIERGAYPYWKDRVGAKTLEEFLAAGIMSRRKTALLADPRVRLMHTTDDFLTPEGALKSFAAGWGSRARVHDGGGHLGQLWTPGFQRDLVELLRVP